MKTLAERLKSLREDAGLSQSELARKVGITPQAVQYIETGNVKTPRKIVEIAQALDVNPYWLLSGEGDPKNRSVINKLRTARENSPSPDDYDPYSEDVSLPATLSDGAKDGPSNTEGQPSNLTIIPASDMRDAGYVLIPKYSVKAGMGNGQLITEENVVNSLAFSMGWLTEMGIASHRLAIISVIGDSMEPTLRPGDNVLIDTGSITVRGDAIYVINYDGELLAKRLQKLVDGTLIIMSDNPAYKEQRVSAEQLHLVRIIGRVVWAGRRF